MLCNEGRHPFYESDMDKRTFYEKLLNPSINFPEDFEEFFKNG